MLSYLWITLACLQLGGTNVVEDSIQACLGKVVGASCQFRLPSINDRFDAPSADYGVLETGTCQEKDGVLLFCRTSPTQDAIDACSGKQNDTMCSFKTTGQDTWVSVEAFTSKQALAGTEGSVYASFEIQGVWSKPELFFNGIGAGEGKKTVFKIAGLPSKVALTVHSNDAWNFWKLLVNDTVVAEDPAGSAGSEVYASYHPPQVFVDSAAFARSRFWLEGPPASQFFDISSYDTNDGQCANSGPCVIRLSAHTAMAKRAETTGCVSVQFFVNGAWFISPDGSQFFCTATLGELKTKSFRMPAWPQKMWIAINSTDAWGFWKLTVNGLDVVEDPAGQAGHAKIDYLGSRLSDVSYWLEAPPRTQTFGIQWGNSVASAPAQSKNFNIEGTCSTAWTGDMFCYDGAYVDTAVVTVMADVERPHYIYGEEDIEGNDPSCCEQFTDWPNVDNFVTCGRCTALVLTRPYASRCDKYCESFGHVCAGAAEELGEQCAVLSLGQCDKPVMGWGRTSDMLCSCRLPAASPSCAAMPGMADGMSFAYVEYVLRGLSFASIRANQNLEDEIKTAAKAAIASEVGAGLTPHHVTHFWMKPGSVMLFAVINLPKSLSVESATALLRGAGPAITSSVSPLPGVQAAASGPINVAAMSVKTWNDERLIEAAKEYEKQHPGQKENENEGSEEKASPEKKDKVEKWMPLKPEKFPNYVDKDDESESEAVLEVGGTHATLIVIVVCVGICLLILAIFCLLLRVMRLKRQLREQNKAQVVAGNASVAVGRPVVPAQGESTENNTVISGTPVVMETNPEKDSKV